MSLTSMPTSAGHSGKYMERKTQGLREVSLWPSPTVALRRRMQCSGIARKPKFLGPEGVSVGTLGAWSLAQ